MIFRYVFAFIILLLSFQSHASRVINSVSLSPNPASIGETITVTISVTGSGEDNEKRWRSTSYRINDGTQVCVNTGNFNSFSMETDTFTISGATNDNEAYKIDFIAYWGNSCNGDDSDIYTNVLSVGTDAYDITLSEDTIFDTDSSLGAVIGNLSVTNVSGGSASVSLHTYNGGTDAGTCSDGTSDNWRFDITNNVLSIGNASGSTIPIGEYTICVKTDDDKFRKNLTIYVVENPAGVTTDITLSNDTIYDYVAYAGSEIGTLAVVDPNSSSSTSSSVALHTHDGNTLVGSCSADAPDNWRFNISDNTLSINNDNGTALEPGEYTICVKTEDDYFRKNLTIYVNEPDESPTFFTLSNNTITLSNSFPDAVIGELVSSDENVDYVWGTSAIHYSNDDVNVGECVGDFSDNKYFYVDGSTLHLEDWINTTFEAREYKICIKGETGNGIEYLHEFTISVSDDITATFLDKFNTQSYANNDGLLEWASDWQEYNDGGSVTSGDIEIEDNRLHLVGRNNFIYREVNLSAFSEAFLSFDYQTNTSASDDDVSILIRTSEDDEWQELYVFEGGSDEQGSLTPIDISEYIDNATEVGIYTADGFDNADDFYLDNFAINASGAVAVQEYIYFDRFNSVSYKNNDGQLDWIGSWDEKNDDDDPDDGKITIVNNELKITSPEVSITREANLSGYSALTLSFNYRTLTSGSDDIVNLQIRSDNLDWITLESFIGSSSSNDSGTFSVDISQYIDKDVDFRFITEDGFDRNDAFYVDDFAISNTISATVCPDISDYRLIFHDDFTESEYKLTDTWFTDDFNRSVTNVWPNDRIYTRTDEELDIVFEIENDTLQIAGDVTRLGNSEYGVLLHDVDDQGYSASTIDEYAVEASLSAHADEIGNNDVGVVFGYQSESDFYLLRWTKIGAGYSNDTVFPGDYRSLDLVWVKNGTATLLASQPSFYSDDPLSVRVTVDDNGISICINGNEVMSYADAQPNMYSVGLFSYDNDYDGGLQVDDFKIYCRECEAEDIIGWWPMEGNLDDIIGVNDLYEIGDVDFGSSNIARTIGSNSTCQYAVMDGQSYGRVDDSGHLNSEDLAVSAWVYPTSYPNDRNDTNGRDSLMAISSKDENYEFHINSNGKLYWWWRNENNSERSLTSISTIPLNAWSHVAISYKAGEQRMYINGVLERSSSWNEIPKQSSCDYFVGADVSTPFFGGSCSVIPERTFIGELDEVRIYGRYLSENEIKADMDRLRECGLINSEVHHYEIIHEPTALTCLQQTATVVACADENCSTQSSSQVTGAFTIDGTTDQSIDFDFSTGLQQITYNNTTSGVVTLGLSNINPAAQQSYVCSEEDCQITFSDSGYLVNVPDFESATGFYEVNVQAVKADDISQTCVPDYVGNQPVNIDFSYKTPDAGNVSTQQALDYSATSNGSVSQINSGTSLNTNLTFSDTDASSSFFIDYDEVGELTLTVSDQNNVLIAGSDNFVVYPSELVIELTDGSGNSFEKYTAAKPFEFKVYAINEDGNLVTNYRAGDLQLASIMAGPTLSDGANEVQFYYNATSSIISQDSSSLERWNSVNLTFNETGYSTNGAKFDNVGVFEVDVQDTDYMGYAISSRNVSTGEFIPYYYVIEEITKGSIQETMTGAAYIGQELEFDSDPEIKIIAKTFSGVTATNYKGDSFSGIDLGFRTYFEQVNIFNGGDTSAGNILVSDNTNYDGSIVVQINGDTVSYKKEATPIAPFDSNITLNLTKEDLTDSDGVGYCSGENLTSCPDSFEDYNVQFTEAPELRYGRLFLENAFGDENSDLKVEMYLQYYNENGKFVTNTDDSTTEFDDFIIQLNDENGNDSGYPYRLDGLTFVDGKTAKNEGLFILAPTVQVELDVEITNLPSYLNVDWDDNEVIDINDKVSSTVIFGSYRGNDRIIYKRER